VAGVRMQEQVRVLGPGQGLGPELVPELVLGQGLVQELALGQELVQVVAREGEVVVGQGAVEV
jgi:hypothetical protein